MNEESWDGCVDPRKLLEFLRGKASDRKLRLFSCGCCRRIWHLLMDKRSRFAVETAERYADGEVLEFDLRQVWQRSHLRNAARTIESWASSAATRAAAEAWDAPTVARSAAWAAGDACRPSPGELASQAALLRDIFGNPFRPFHVDPLWRTADVVTLAEAAYAERLLPSGELDPARLAVLGDALEEAGASGEILTHLREPGLHVRGCWAVDACLGKS